MDGQVKIEYILVSLLLFNQIRIRSMKYALSVRELQ